MKFERLYYTENYTSQCTVMSKIWETEMNFFDIFWWHQPVLPSCGTVSVPAHKNGH